MKVIRVTITIILIFFAAVPSFAANAKRSAVIAAVRGSVEVKPLKGEWVPAKANTTLAEGDFIKTGKDSWVLINIDDSGETASVELKESSNMELSLLSIDEKTGATRTLLDMYAGEVMVKAKNLGGKKSKFDVKTPTSIVAVKGDSASFSVKVERIE
ncbi:MAG: FecR domain-containing protein [Candidatus Omnitrophica bacterium]|nr:FecR domain-containing protein [Candidatus Omnitrophota bacterium]MCM8790740.1 FecR domain-containing protein [Candidatus Omnitrophota bacterium]